MAQVTTKTGVTVYTLELSEQEAKAVFAAVNFVFSQLDNDEGIEPILGEVGDELANALENNDASVDTAVEFKDSVFNDSDDQYNYNLRTVVG